MRCDPVKHNYSLRASTQPVVTYTDYKSNHGEWSFGSFFSNFYNKIAINKSIYALSNFENFIKMINLNISDIIDKVFYIFPKFNTFVNFGQICF